MMVGREGGSKITQRYFEKFPVFEYANTLIRDITRRCVFPQDLKADVSAFYPYDIKNEQRSDVLAFNYYNDTDADWLIYLMNGIIDPYYGWYLNNDQFKQSLIDKYGSLIDPVQRIKYWQTNWFNDDSNATLAYYNGLGPAQQKYWTPVWGPSNRVLFYKRRQEDWFMHTNQIWTVQVANNHVFNVADLVKSNTNVGVFEGSAEVSGISSDGITMQLKNIANTISVGSTLLNFVNNSISSVVSSVSVTQVSIPLSEAVYWTPVSVYDYENDLNEKNKSLLLLDKQFLTTAATTLTKNLNA